SPVPTSHTRALLSSPAVMRRRSSGLNAASSTVPLCSSGASSGTPRTASQTRAVLSSLAVPTSRPPELNVARGHPLPPRKGGPGGRSGRDIEDLSRGAPAILQGPPAVGACWRGWGSGPFLRSHFVGPGQFPQAHRAVRASRDDPPAVGAEVGKNNAAVVAQG